MLKVELYLPGEGTLHSIDPRLKMGGLVGISLLITAVNPAGLTSLTIGLLVLLGLSHIPLREFKTIGYAILLLGCFYIFFLSWNWGGTWRIWQGNWSREGFNQAIIIIWRISLAFILTRIVIGVTSPTEQGVGIAYFFTPFYRVSPKVADFALLITLTLRFIPLLIEEASLLYKARVAKGNLPESFPKKLVELASFLVPLLLLTLRRAEELAENLIARGYVSGGFRTLGMKEWESKDTLGTLLFLAWGISTLLVEYLF